MFPSLNTSQNSFQSENYKFIQIVDKFELLFNIKDKTVNLTKFCLDITNLFKIRCNFTDIFYEDMIQDLIYGIYKNKIDHKITLKDAVNLNILDKIERKNNKKYNGYYGNLHLLDYIIITTMPEYHKVIWDKLCSIYKIEILKIKNKEIEELQMKYQKLKEIKDDITYLQIMNNKLMSDNLNLSTVNKIIFKKNSLLESKLKNKETYINETKKIVIITILLVIYNMLINVLYY